MNHFFRESGQLNHWRKWWPVYGMSALGASVVINPIPTPSNRHNPKLQREDIKSSHPPTRPVLLGQSWRFRDATLRRSFAAQLQEVWRQFLGTRWTRDGGDQVHRVGVHSRWFGKRSWMTEVLARVDRVSLQAVLGGLAPTISQGLFALGDPIPSSKSLLQEELRVQLRDLRAEEAYLTSPATSSPNFQLLFTSPPHQSPHLSGGLGAHGGRFRAFRPRRASLRGDHGWPETPSWMAPAVAIVLEKLLPLSLGAGDAALPELYFEWSMTVGVVGSVSFYVYRYYDLTSMLACPPQDEPDQQRGHRPFGGVPVSGDAMGKMRENQAWKRLQHKIGASGFAEGVKS